MTTRCWHPRERGRSSRPFCPPPLVSVVFSSIYLFMSMYVCLSVCSRREENRRCVSSDSRVRVSTYADACPMRQTGEGERRYFIACRCSCGLHFRLRVSLAVVLVLVVLPLLIFLRVFCLHASKRNTQILYDEFYTNCINETLMKLFTRASACAAERLKA